MSALEWLTRRPVAHRGLHDAARGVVENTASAVQAAIDAGYAIEVDLQLTADGEAVVFHDDTLERLTRAAGRLIDLELRTVQAAPFRAGGDRIQTLGELLDQVAGRATLVIELKSQWDTVGPLESRVARLLSTYRGPVAVMSFDTRSMAAMREIAPGITRGIVAERFDADPNPAVRLRD